MSKVTLEKSRLTRFRQQLRPNVEAANTKTVTTGIERSQEIVRKASHDLEKSIVAGGEGLEQDWGSSLAYAAAQEFGRPDLTDQGRTYTFTPYLKPTAEGLRDEHTQNVADAVRKAL